MMTYPGTWKTLNPHSESELYSMIPSGSETGRFRPWGIGLMAEGTSGY